MERKELMNEFYGHMYSEEERLNRTCHGRLEYFTTMHYIHQYLKPNATILEVGAGTGRYSIALAKEGYDVHAIEYVQSNLDVLLKNKGDLQNIIGEQGDAVDLSRFADETFDVTLVLGPMYHLYEKEDQLKALQEAIRVTKKGGKVLVAFIPIMAVMYNQYVCDNFLEGLAENFDENYQVIHFTEQMFTGFDVEEFEALFTGMNIKHLKTVGVDSVLENVEQRPDFKIDDFDKFCDFYLHVCEKRTLLGTTNHCLYIGERL